MTDSPATPSSYAPRPSPEQARAAVLESLRQVVPDADLGAVDDDTRIRSELELDSLDFLAFVELLSSRARTEIHETDYPRLATLGSAVEFLSGP